MSVVPNCGVMSDAMRLRTGLQKIVDAGMDDYVIRGMLAELNDPESVLSRDMSRPTSMSARIQDLYDLIKRDFPRGCDELRCENCPLDDRHNTVIEAEVCDMLVRLQSLAD